MSCISFLNTCPSSGDTEQQLLSKILQVINTTGGGIAGVSSISINGGAPQTGAVSITTGGTVTSVNGDPGPAVSLDSGEIPEGANLYFTTARVRATDLTGFASALGAITAADTILSAFGKTQGRLAALEAGTAGPFLLKAGDTGTGAFLFTPAAVDVIPLTLTSAVGSATTSSLFVATGGATNRLTIRNDGRFILAGRILATNTDVLGNTLNFSDAGTTNAPILLALGHTSTAGLGTAAAGFGAMLDFNLDSTTTLATRATRQTVAWTDATHATRTASTTFFAFTSGSETTQLTLTNNQIQGGDGTAALPTFTTRNAPTQGLFFPTTTSIAWSISAAEQARLTTTGLGIGNTPGHKLSVTGSTFDVISWVQGALSRGYLESDATGVGIFSGANATGSGVYLSSVSNYLEFQVSATPVARMIASGDFGVGTTIPQERLSIVKVAGAAAAVYEVLTDASNYSRTKIVATAGNHTIRTEAAGTGTLRILQVGTGPSTGTDIAGKDTIIHSGQPTGSGVPGAILFQQGLPVGGTGAAVTALATSGSFTTAGLFTTKFSHRAHDATAIPAGGTAGAGLMVSSTANFGVFFGSGAPGLAAAKGSLYLRSDGGGTNDRAYINTDGGTTWTAIVTVA